MKSKIILLILGMLFLCVNIGRDSKEVKQNDSITSIAAVTNNYSVDYSSISNDYSFIHPQYIMSSNSDMTTTSTISNSNHFSEVSKDLSLNTDFNRNKYINMFKVKNGDTQSIRSKTLGLVGSNRNNVYFNLYLYHFINKLGCT